MFKKIKLAITLKKMNCLLWYLPDGLYTPENKYIHGSNLLKDLFREYPFGSVFKIKKENIKFFSRLKNAFQQQFPYKSSYFKSIDFRKLNYEHICNEIKKFQYDKNKTPYENYLEAVVIQLTIQSFNYGKSLVGGVWGSGAVLSNIRNKGKGTFAYFAANIQEKNDFIAQLKKKREEYPDDYILSACEYKIKEFNKNTSQYASLMEYRILQIRYKIILQEICLHSYYFTEKEKIKFDKEYNRIKILMKTYPVE